jgi:DNA-binding response OmpR family regulator
MGETHQAVPTTDTRPVVLLVDADTDQLKRLADSLRAADLQLRFATDAAMAVETVAHARPNIVLLAGELPDMDGIEALRRIDDSEAGRGLPILLTGRPSAAITSASATVDARADAINTGAADFIALPSSPREVRATVRRLLPSTADTTDPVDTLLDQLDTLLGSGSTRALGCLPRLTEAFGTPAPSKLPQLVAQVEGYDFKAARKTLRDL